MRNASGNTQYKQGGAGFEDEVAVAATATTGLRHRKSPLHGEIETSSCNQTDPHDHRDTASSLTRNASVEPNKSAQEKSTFDAAKAIDIVKQQKINPSWPLSYHFAKWSILRLLGLVYWFAFCGAWYQNEGLMGRDGILPANLDSILQQYRGQLLQGFVKHPMIFWFGIPFHDTTLRMVIASGWLLSSLVAFWGVNSWLIQVMLWLLDFTIVTVSSHTSFYGYGWESQLLETGFLAIFLCELPHMRFITMPVDDDDEDGKNNKSKSINQGKQPWWRRISIRLELALWEGTSTPTTMTETTATDQRSSLLSQTMTTPPKPSPIILWLFRWLCFRISLGAGLIKIRGSSCWTQKTCLHYHFETQPIPSPLSFVYHFLPRAVQSHMVDIDLIVQLYTSALVLVPVEWFVTSPWSVFRTARSILRLAGVLQVGFMVGIILSGNFAFLNHLTIVPALACFDDDFFPKRLQSSRKAEVTSDAVSQDIPNTRYSWMKQPRRWLDVTLFLWICWLSRPVINNLLNKRQLMNASFDPFRIVNTYGAFGSVGKARYEPIISISDDMKDWTELELPCKPGNVRRRPCFCAPYHYRLDWNIWFIGFKPHQSYLRQREFWMFALLRKIIEPETGKNDGGHVRRPWLNLLNRETAGYLKTKYYGQGSAPRYIKVDMYHYKMAGSLWYILWKWVKGEDIIWWKRRFEESLIQIIEWDAESSQMRFVNVR